jgi:hypothetical protein
MAIPATAAGKHDRERSDKDEMPDHKTAVHARHAFTPED